MDSDTEDRILKNLKNNFKNKTLIIISHRISCVKDADNIIVLDNGKIIQSEVQSIIEKQGYYKDLYLKQNSED